jgi:hypothetical protein
MYNISEIIDVILCLTVTYKLIQTIPYIYVTVNTGYFFLTDFLDVISENNPLLIDYYDNLNEENEKTTVLKSEIEIEKIEQKYEDKYLEKFKRFPNEFQFTELEMEEEKKEFENIKTTTETNRNQSINKIKEQLGKIYDIENGDNLTSELNENVTENINTLCKNGLIQFFNLEDEEPDDIDFEQLYIDLIEKKNELKKELKCIEETIFEDEDEDMLIAAREIIVTRKLDKFIDNYILEHTPLGNIYMRYNNSKKSFEYFSNSTMPYRYLEPVGRKYVMTYWCKPLFIDIEEELKKSEQKNEEMKRKEDDNKRMVEELKTGSGAKDVIAKLKNYNKDTKNQANMKPQMKNRSGSNFVLPPQIKANLPNVNQQNEKHLLKENANRYTCEGRLTGFSPLKKIDKKILDKNLSMSYADFKKIQKEEQNKK